MTNKQSDSKTSRLTAVSVGDIFTPASKEKEKLLDCIATSINDGDGKKHHLAWLYGGDLHRARKKLSNGSAGGEFDLIVHAEESGGASEPGTQPVEKQVVLLASGDAGIRGAKKFNRLGGYSAIVMTELTEGARQDSPEGTTPLSIAKQYFQHLKNAVTKRIAQKHPTLNRYVFGTFVRTEEGVEYIKNLVEHVMGVPADKESVGEIPDWVKTHASVDIPDDCEFDDSYCCRMVFPDEATTEPALHIAGVGYKVVNRVPVEKHLTVSLDNGDEYEYELTDCYLEILMSKDMTWKERMQQAIQLGQQHQQISFQELREAEIFEEEILPEIYRLAGYTTDEETGAYNIVPPNSTITELKENLDLLLMGFQRGQVMVDN